METLEAIKNRHSSRSYLSKEIEGEKLNSVLETARLAPSARNRQPWHFLVIRTKENKEKVMQAQKSQRNFNEWMNAAPCFIVILTDTEISKEYDDNYHLFDLGLAVQNMFIAATSLGLGGCIVTGFYKDKLDKILELPEKYKSVGILVLGYAEPSTEKQKKSFEEITSFEKI